MPITVTEKAASKVKEIVAAGQKDGTLPQERLYLRLRVVGGGCSGFQNKLDLDPEMHEGRDEVFEFFGVPVVVDKKSLIYLNDAMVDYHDEQFRSGFSINNPNAKSTCGCGSSYTV
jgi:iron-sulfur cluster assembly accessory protein